MNKRIGLALFVGLGVVAQQGLSFFSANTLGRIIEPGESVMRASGTVLVTNSTAKPLLVGVTDQTVEEYQSVMTCREQLVKDNYDKRMRFAYHPLGDWDPYFSEDECPASRLSEYLLKPGQRLLLLSSQVHSLWLLESSEQDLYGARGGSGGMDLFRWSGRQQKLQERLQKDWDRRSVAITSDIRAVNLVTKPDGAQEKLFIEVE